MWYDWEWIQWAKEEWWYLEVKPESPLGRKIRWKLLVKAALAYLRSGKVQEENSTIRDAVRLAHGWVQSNFQGIGVWLGTGQH